jgi:hypothetical protein
MSRWFSQFPLARPGQTPAERAARELVLFATLLLAGLLVLPGLAWLLGLALLGSQAEGLGPGDVYGSVFGEAVRGRPTAWLFAATPWFVVQSVRLACWPLRRMRSAELAGPGAAEAEQAADRP